MQEELPDTSIPELLAAADGEGRLGTARVLGELASIDGSSWHLCAHPLEYRRGLNPLLDSLHDGTPFANPFFEPAFVAASRARVNNSPITLLVLWEIYADQRQARLVIPVIEQSGNLLMPAHLNALTHPYAPLGDPVIDGQDTKAVVARFLELLRKGTASGMPPIVINYLSDQSPLFGIGSEDEMVKGLPMARIPIGSRPAFVPGKKTYGDYISSKRRRELERLERRLSEHGAVTLERASDYFEVVLRFEEFLLMESRSWKGRQGSAIHSLKRNAAFARQATVDLAKAGKAAIYSLRLDDKAIASMIVFKTGNRIFPWKIAFDETYARLAPGMLLMARFSKTLVGDRSIALADSLAATGKGWMSELWSDQTDLETLILGSDATDVGKLERVFRSRLAAKNLLKRFLRRNSPSSR